MPITGPLAEGARTVTGDALQSAVTDRLDEDTAVKVIVQPSPEPDSHVLDKQIHRWLTEGGAVLPHD